MVHPLIQRLQSVDYLAEPRQAHDRVLHAVRLLENNAGPWREGANPFPGFGSVHRGAQPGVFRSRGRDPRVHNRVRVMGNASGLLAIVGPSDCGKSSLLNAAVMPAAQTWVNAAARLLACLTWLCA
ncbi:MAG: hypothetical protein ACRDQY_17995 [Pseudonocardiaceae bacterium]